MNSALIVALFVILTLGISYWNARVCGQVWEDAKLLGAGYRVLVWSGAIQSAIGFSSVLLIALGGAAYVLDCLPAAYVEHMFELWYVLIIAPALMTGWIITVHSWIAVARERSLANMGAAAWNTYSSLHNTGGVVNRIGDALGGVDRLFGGTDSDDIPAGLVMLVVALVASSLLGGVFLTAAIIQANKGTLPAPSMANA